MSSTTKNRLQALASTGLGLVRLKAADGGRSAFARRWLKFPLEYRATQQLEHLEHLSVPELLAELGGSTLTFDHASSAHGWNLGALEQALLGESARLVGASTAFEIGTFDGSTTRVLASAVGTGGRVLTLDLPPSAFDASQFPEGFEGADVGREFRDAPEGDRITQLLGNSLEFDFSPWHATVDLVFVDGAHDYEHGLSDSRNALRLLRPDGLVFWDDVTPYWHGLIAGICEATAGRRLRVIDGTSLAVLVA